MWYSKWKNAWLLFSLSLITFNNVICLFTGLNLLVLQFNIFQRKMYVSKRKIINFFVSLKTKICTVRWMYQCCQHWCRRKDISGCERGWNILTVYNAQAFSLVSVSIARWFVVGGFSLYFLKELCKTFQCRTWGISRILLPVSYSIFLPVSYP